MTMMETIKNDRHETIGFIIKAGSRLRLTDSQHQTLGWYDPGRDRTTDAGNRTFGSGNQLLRLLPSVRL